MAAAGSPAEHWPSFVVFGAGAVGCFFGAQLARAGAPVTLIGREAHVAAIQSQGLAFERGGSLIHIPLQATTDPEAVSEADIVLFCVKSRDTDSGARRIAPLLKPGAVVVSLQNGVDNVPRIRESAGIDALAAVVYVACSMPGPGHVRHAGRGDLVLGQVPAGASGSAWPGQTPDQVRRIADCFERAEVPCPVSPDVRADLWVKLVMNCVFNPISALGRTVYRRLVSDPPTRELMAQVIRECVAVARADGVNLPDSDALLESALSLGQAMAEARSSTAQDLAAGRPTEIDSLNGYVARRGAALGVPTPVNQALLALVGLVQTA